MGRLTNIDITDSGFGYSTAPLITISPPTADSSNAAATLTRDTINNRVASVTLVDSGQYYISPPTTTVSLPTADSADAVATVDLHKALQVIGVTVIDSGGNKFAVNTVIQDTVQANELSTYRFDQSDSSNSGHPLRFSTVSDGTHGGGSQFTSNVTAVGTPGTLGAYTDIVMPRSERKLYYYCSNHSGMGGPIVISHRVMQGISLTSGGTYYTSAPNVNFTTVHNLPTNFRSGVEFDSDRGRFYPTANFGERSYVLDSAGGDSDYPNFTDSSDNPSVTINQKIDFWLYSPGSRTSDIISFVGHKDSAAGTASKIRMEGQNLKWHYIKADGTGDSIGSTSNPITANTWHYVQLQIDSAGNYKMYIDSSLEDSSPVSGTPGRLISGKTRFLNRPASADIAINAFRYTLGSEANTIFTSSLPDSDRNPYDDNADSDLNYLNFEQREPSATATISSGQVTGVSIDTKGAYIDSARISFDSAGKGTAADFRAIVTTAVDSSRGGTLSFSLTDSGQFYTSGTPTVTVGAANGTASDYTALATCTIDSAERKVNSLTITYAGAGYRVGSFPTVTFAAPPNTDIKAGDSASQTLASGVIVNGEVAKYSDSDGVLHLIHVGSDDSSYQTFVAGRNITFGGEKREQFTRLVSAVSEDNKIASNEQNTDFDNIEAGFLDFSETNPFGDPQ